MKTSANSSEDTRTIRRVNETRQFVVISNATAQDERLSYEARGLLLYLLSLPDDWELRVSHLQKQGGQRKQDDDGDGACHMGRDSVRRLLRELQRFGYVSGYGEQGREGHGRFGKPEVVVYSKPSLNPEYSPETENQSTVENPATERPATDSPSPENQSPYKEHRPQRTQGQQNTHTQTRLRAVAPAPAAPAGGGVGVDSKFSFPERLRYARNQSSIRDAESWANSKRACAGEFDPRIETWLAEVEPQRVESGEIRPPARVDASQCPDCRGSGMWYPGGLTPEGMAQGVVKCRHPKLTTAAA